MFISQISGNANVEQLLNAAASCMKKPAIAEYILNDFFTSLWALNFQQKDKILKMTLDVLTTNAKFKPVQTIGMSVLTNNSL